MKRFIEIISVFLVLTLVLSFVGCGTTNSKQGEKPTKESKEITVWIEKVFSDEANTAMESRLKQFGEEKGISVKCEFISAVDFMTKLNASVESGKVPDVVSGAAHKILNYYPNNPFLEVSDIVDTLHTSRGYFDSILQGSKIDNKYYFVPFQSSSNLLFLRKDVLEKNGIKELPETWDEVIDIAYRINDPQNGLYGLGVGCGPTDEDCENTIRTLLWAYGGSVFDEEGNPNVSDPNSKKVFEKYVQLYKDGIIPPHAKTWDPGGNNKTYLMGESAIVYNAPTLCNAIKEQDEELFKNTIVMAPPKGPEGRVLFGFISGFSIMQDSKNIDAAKELVQYLYDESWYSEYLKSTAPVFAPVFEDTAQLPLWQGSVNKEVVEYAKNASGYYGYPVQAVKGRAVAAKHYFKFPIANLLNNMVVEDKPIDEAVKEMEDDIKTIYESVE